MFKVSDLNKRDIVNVVDGSKLGPVKDIHIDVEKGTVEAIILQGPRRFWLFSSRKDFIVPWGAVKKLGKDAVLIEVHDWTV
ncbi:MAG: Sporulation protein, YlmC/YmxH family [Desulfotomaculum sp. 46_296]|nr:MAG: Sporulation protein, YlmC/YmxH family [Desulfotomaculum sp. 46_296]KUK84870.1 MAG: Sporulation protein, YlmC/YmxH family [Desulfofundulus kuznetsovii]HAU31639.1 YlmC/YmxH family sporulation protein [Desulfotomaculum sp.]